ncbi:MAG: serine/threonine-protein phosphatase, partial [Micromonospora sp.]
MTAADVRDSDPGDGRIATPRPARAAAWSVDSPSAPALPPLAPDRGLATPHWSEVVEHFREGLIVCDSAGVVRHLSPVAERLLPEVVPGELLAAAGVPALTGEPPVEFGHRGRRLRVRQVPLSGARCCWYVEDVTESVSRADALLAERARSAFLAVVGEKLGNPLHPDRAAAAVVRLAVPSVADVAVLVLAP